MKTPIQLDLKQLFSISVPALSTVSPGRDEDGKMSSFQHTVFFENKTMDKSQNPTNRKYNILTSEPLRREYFVLLEMK